MLAFNLYCYIEFCIFNRVETIEELIFVKLNLEQTSNTFWRYKLGEVTSGKIHHVGGLIIKIGEKADLKISPISGLT